MKYELLYRIWWVRIEAFRQKIYLFNIMSFVFNYGPQSGWERGTGGTVRYLRDGDPLLHQFRLKSLYSWVERGAGLGLQICPDEKIQRVKIRDSCRPVVIAYEWGDFPLIPGLGDLGSVRGRRFLLQGLGNHLEVLLCPGQQATFQNVGDVELGVQFDSRGHKKQRGPPGLCDGRPNPKRDDPSLCGWRGSPNSIHFVSRSGLKRTDLRNSIVFRKILVFGRNGNKKCPSISCWNKFSFSAVGKRGKWRVSVCK